MFYYLFILLIVLLLIEIFFSPRLEITKYRQVLLFYGKKNRDFIILFKF